jgi:hypothetical protein
MNDTTKKQLEEIFGKLAVEAGALLEPAYGAAIGRFAITEALALEQHINSKNYQEAKALIRSKMTAQELADEKTKLAELTFDAAATNSQQWSVAGQALQAGLKVLLALALSAAGL